MISRNVTFIFLMLCATFAWAGGPNSLFVGTGNFIPGGSNDVFNIDPVSGTNSSLFNADVWGMCSDNVNGLIYYTSADGSGTVAGSNLWVFPVDGSAPTALLGIISSTGAEIRIDGLAISGGTLYGVHQFSESARPAGIYSIDLGTLEATFVVALGEGAVGGLAADPITGLLYMTNDATGMVESYNIGTNTFAVVCAYPAAETDIDGIAADDQGQAFLVTDDAGDPVYVLNIAACTYTSIPGVFGVTDTFSGGAAFVCLGAAAAIVPTLGEWGVICLGLLMMILGTVVLTQRKRIFAV